MSLHYLTTPAEATGLRLKEAGVTDTIVRPAGLFDLWHTLDDATLHNAAAQAVAVAAGTRPHAATFCFSNITPRLNPWSATEAEWQVFVVNLARFATVAKAAGVVGFALDSEVYQEVVAAGVGAWKARPEMQQRGKDYRQALQGLQASTYLPLRSPWAPILTTNIHPNHTADRAEGFFAFWRGVGLANLSVLYEDLYGWDGKGPFGKNFQTELRVHFRSQHGPLPVAGSTRLAKLDRQIRGPLPHFACGLELTAASLLKLESALAGRKALGGAWLYPGGEKLLADPAVCARVKRCVG